MKKRSGKQKNYEKISVCVRWKKFENFLADMGERPERKTLDRIDNKKGYSLKNCRWATLSEQQRNRSDSHFLIYKNQKKHYKDWAEIIKVKPGTILRRIKRGWSVDKIINKTQIKYDSIETIPKRGRK